MKSDTNKNTSQNLTRYMRTSYPYIFGYENGLPPEWTKQKRENEAFERFLEISLGSDNYEKRNQMRLMERAISVVVDELIASR